MFSSPWWPDDLRMPSCLFFRIWARGGRFPASAGIGLGILRIRISHVSIYLRNPNPPNRFRRVVIGERAQLATPRCRAPKMAERAHLLRRGTVRPLRHRPRRLYSPFALVSHERHVSPMVLSIGGGGELAICRRRRVSREVRSRDFSRYQVIPRARGGTSCIETVVR